MLHVEGQEARALYQEELCEEVGQAEEGVCQEGDAQGPSVALSRLSPSSLQPAREQRVDDQEPALGALNLPPGNQRSDRTLR